MGKSIENRASGVATLDAKARRLRGILLSMAGWDIRSLEG